MTDGHEDDRTPTDPPRSPTTGRGAPSEGAPVLRSDDQRAAQRSVPADAPSVFAPAPNAPELAPGQAATPPPMVDPVTQPRPGASTWYRTDEDRAKSVYRRANPWYRRVARAVIGLSFLGAAAVGLYFGARAAQDWLDRDRLPSAGAEVPEIRATSFLVTSSDPAPLVDGTLTMDASTGAFEFVGRATGPQAGLQVVSPDGATVYVRQGTGAWRSVGAADTSAAQIVTAARYLADDATADAILTNRLRRGFVQLVAQVDEGEGDEQLTRYEMSLDTQGFAVEFPLQWQSFRNDAVPGAQEASAVPVTIWLDREDVLVRVSDEQANWAWERLTYSDQPFAPLDPGDDGQTQVTQVACVSADNQVFWQTPFASCDAAMSVARELALETGVAEALGDPAADRTVAVICSTMERETGPLPASAEEVALAQALVEGGVCRGDPTIFTTG